MSIHRIQSVDIHNAYTDIPSATNHTRRIHYSTDILTMQTYTCIYKDALCFFVGGKIHPTIRPLYIHAIGDRSKSLYIYIICASIMYLYISRYIRHIELDSEIDIYMRYIPMCVYKYVFAQYRWVESAIVASLQTNLLLFLFLYATCECALMRFVSSRQRRACGTMTATFHLPRARIWCKINAPVVGLER